MDNLAFWNWHYQIFFEQDTLNAVNSFIEKLKKDEQEIYLYIRDFFLSFYSISQLIDVMEKYPDRGQHFLEVANQHKDKLILTPSLLCKSVEERAALLPEQCRDGVLQLLDRSRASQYTPDFKGYCNVVFGDLYHEIIGIALAGDAPTVIDHGRMLKSDEVIPFAQREIETLLKDRDTLHKYGALHMEKYDIEICHRAGYAEWWDRDLLDGERDRLILFQNADSMFAHDLKYTIIHEVFPGHGLFYNDLAHNSGCMFDHGAVALIEGWATYAEWNTIPSDYIRQIRQNGCAFLAQSISLQGEALAQNILSRKRALGFSEDECLRTITRALQYIGFLESYYLGALWIELYLSKRKLRPVDFLHRIKTRNIGEFFSLW